MKKFVEGWRVASANGGSQPKTAGGKPQNQNAPNNSNTTSEMFPVPSFMDKLGSKVAGVNLLEIEAYLRASKVGRKIAGYSVKQMEKEQEQAEKETTKQVGRQKHSAKRGSEAKPNATKPAASKRGAIPPLHAVEAFMFALAGASKDGRVSLTLIGKADVEIKYLLLNPAPPFLEVVEKARSVILAGGTMSPVRGH